MSARRPSQAPGVANLNEGRSLTHRRTAILSRVTTLISLRRLSRPGLSLLGAVAIIAALGWTWARVAQTLQHAHSPANDARPNAIVWGDRVFSRDRSLAYWLGERGRSYRTWAKRHPAASRVFEKG
jgi:hypothetical protein